MTRIYAIRQFKETYAVLLAKKPADAHEVREAWGVFLDFLCKSGLITAKQYGRWDLETSPKKVKGTGNAFLS